VIQYTFFFAELCTRLGYCLSHDQQSQIMQQQVESIDDFIELIMLTEGLQPAYVDRSQKRELKRFIERFWQSEPEPS
jgi:hypothetical protein